MCSRAGENWPTTPFPELDEEGHSSAKSSAKGKPTTIFIVCGIHTPSGKKSTVELGKMACRNLSRAEQIARDAAAGHMVKKREMSTQTDVEDEEPLGEPYEEGLTTILENGDCYQVFIRSVELV